MQIGITSTQAVQMQSYFYALADFATTQLHSREILLCYLRGEQSDFVRFNRNRVRQAGRVHQQQLHIDLIAGHRHSAGILALNGNRATDEQALRELLQQLRHNRNAVPEDPYLNYCPAGRSSETLLTGTIPAHEEMLETITDNAGEMDLVGLWSAGPMFSGFANSMGQRNWHESRSFQFDWSCHDHGDKAVKAQYAGTDWEPRTLAARMEAVRQDLELMRRPAKSLAPGHYRVYLAPAALYEITRLLGWGGFGLKSHRTRRTPLLKMIQENQPLHPSVTLVENHSNGLAPRFTPEGFAKPEQIKLISEGSYRACLADARSAQEYRVEVNASREEPLSLEMAPGNLASEDVLASLDTGLFVQHLWYANYSDRNNCCLTGMTRFACFWVEQGVIQSPIEVLRFDDSIYPMLGSNLVALTRERQRLFDQYSYDHRSWTTALLPGALVSDLCFTL